MMVLIENVFHHLLILRENWDLMEEGKLKLSLLVVLSFQGQVPYYLLIKICRNLSLDFAVINWKIIIIFIKDLFAVFK